VLEGLPVPTMAWSATDRFAPGKWLVAGNLDRAWTMLRRTGQSKRQRFHGCSLETAVRWRGRPARKGCGRAVMSNARRTPDRRPNGLARQAVSANFCSVRYNDNADFRGSGPSHGNRPAQWDRGTLSVTVFRRAGRPCLYARALRRECGQTVGAEDNSRCAVLACAHATLHNPLR